MRTVLREAPDMEKSYASDAMDVKEYLEYQDREIERHKWIESEKAGRDLGLDAVIDWIMKYADAFSEHFLQEKRRD
jgi:hypothetical protein